MDGILAAALLAAGVIFVAELGDKSQLLAMTFATRYRALPVLLGITAGTAAAHALSVAIGFGLGAALPTGWLNLVAALAFFGFAAWTLRGEEESDDAEAAPKRTGPAVVTVAVAFFLAELGDKTMLVTITLAAQHGWFGTWIGAVVGMVAADALALALGLWLGKRLPERLLRYGAAALFAVFGVLLAIEAARTLGCV
ncbi:MAG: TMEM165/GDT1 family protein [Stackebrandtia sp.]